MSRGSQLGRRYDTALFAAILAGPLAWAAQLVLSYALVPTARRAGRKTLLYAITACALVGPLVSALVCWRRYGEAKRLPSRGDPSHVTPEGASATPSRAHFMAGAGLAVAAFFFLVILVGLAPPLLLHLGDE